MTAKAVKEGICCRVVGLTRRTEERCHRREEGKRTVVAVCEESGVQCPSAVRLGGPHPRKSNGTLLGQHCICKNAGSVPHTADRHGEPDEPTNVRQFTGVTPLDVSHLAARPQYPPVRGDAIHERASARSQRD
eukprot:136048-Prymnesium_polylepis.2